MAMLLCLLLLAGFSAAIKLQNLPGQPPVNWNQYVGYYDVGTNHHLFYWFVESQNNPSKDPVLLWLTGGPGCSGISALLTEWGPFMVNDDGATLRTNPYSWNRNASVLVLEAPAGVGYSYSDGSVQTDDTQTASENWEALKAFFTEFSQYKANDFYVTGESYGGIYVPTLVQTILDRQSQFNINIKGFAIGNGCVQDDEGTDSIIQFVYNHGMIDDTTWQKVSSQCCDGKIDGCAFHNFNGFDFCSSFVNEAASAAWYSGINPYNMYHSCVNTRAQVSKRFLIDFKMHTGKDLPMTRETVPCLNETAVITYMNRQDVRTALNIPSKLPRWDMCSTEVAQTYGRITADTSPNFKNAINAGLRALMYYGDIDMACNFLMGQRFSRALGYSRTRAKTAFHVDGQVGGYHTKYGNLEFVTVRGSGHMVPTDNPSVAFHVLDAFLNKRNP